MKGILKKIQSKSVPIAGIFVSIYILFLGLTNRLIFYIHPDYKWLAFTMSTILLVVSVFGLFFYHSHGKRNIFSRFVLVPALFVILIGVVIEPASLTSNTALRRGIDDDNSVLTKDSNIPTFSDFGQDTRGFDISIWLKSLYLNPDPSHYSGKKLSIVGFYHVSPDIPANLFYVSRYVITCCSVDARAIGILSEIYSKTHFKEGDWIQVEGEFEIKNVNGKDSTVIKPTLISETKKPDSPYIY